MTFSVWCRSTHRDTEFLLLVRGKCLWTKVINFTFFRLLWLTVYSLMCRVCSFGSFFLVGNVGHFQYSRHRWASLIAWIKFWISGVPAMINVCALCISYQRFYSMCHMILKIACQCRSEEQGDGGSIAARWRFVCIQYVFCLFSMYILAVSMALFDRTVNSDRKWVERERMICSNLPTSVHGWILGQCQNPILV